MKKVVVFLFASALLFVCRAQEFANSERYLVDSLLIKELPESDQILLDSILDQYHSSEEDTAKMKLISYLNSEFKSLKAPILYTNWLVGFIEEKLEEKPSIEVEKVFLRGLAYTHKTTALSAIYSGELDKAGVYFRKALEMHLKAKNLIGISSSYSNMASYFLYRNKTDSGINYLEKAIVAYEQVGNKRGVASCLSNFGVVYKDVGDLEKSLAYQLQSLEMYEELDLPGDIAIANSGIGAIYYNLKDYETALEYYLRAQEGIEKADMYNDLVIVKLRLKMVYSDLEQVDKALLMLDEALKISEKHDLKLHLGKINTEYAHIYTWKKDYPKALEYLQKSIELNKKMGHESDVCYSLISFGEIALIQKDINKAKKLGVEAHAISTRLELPFDIKATSDFLVNVYKKEGNWEKAFEMQEINNQMRDSIQKEDGRRNTLKMTMEHSYSKQKVLDEKERDAQIALANKDKENQRNIAIASVIGALLTLAFLIIIFYRLRKTRKQKQVIEEQSNKLLELDKTKTKFFNNVAHELRTPLTLMSGHMESMLGERFGGLNESQRKSVLIAKQNSNRLMDLVSEILDLGKLESGKLELKSKPILFKPFLDRIFFTFESLAFQFDIALSFDYKISEGLVLKIDDKKIEKALNNLIFNAIKFTPRGGKVVLEVKQSAESVILNVSDSGRGIEANELKKVFERYYQSTNENAPAQGGTGIGLTIVKEFVELHAGTVTVQSKPNEKTTFTVNLPSSIITDEKIDTVSVKEEMENLNPSFPVLKGRKFSIMVIDDHKEMQRYISDLLSPYAKVIIANDGKEALELLEKNRVDLITVDVMMPNMDGFDFMKTIKNDPELRFIPTIMLTARAAEEDKLEALSIGVNDYITKPFSQPELLARVANLIENKLEREEEIKENDSEKLLEADEHLIENLRSIILENIAESNFNVSVLAEKIGMSERQLSRTLKPITGLSPLKFIREIKLQKALELLKSNQYATIAEVCYAVGFEKPGYFTQIFTTRFGKNPSNYLS